MNRYRYGFNGKENDNEVKGEGNQIDYGMRVYDPRIGKFLSVDPLTKDYPELTPYQYASNTPIWAIDIDGLEGGISNPTQLVGGGPDWGAATSWVNSPAAEWQKKGLIAQINATQYGGTDLTPEDYSDLTQGEYLFMTWAYSQMGRNSPGRVQIPNTRGMKQPQTPKVISTKAPGSAAIEQPTVATQGVNLQQRAQEIHQTLKPGTQSRNTTAVGEAVDADGTPFYLVASNEKRLRPAQIAALKPNEKPVVGPGHAEATIVNHANENNITLKGVAASRPICAGCAATLNSNNVVPLSPLKKPPPIKPVKLLPGGTTP